jgi:hypothetical protein
MTKEMIKFNEIENAFFKIKTSTGVAEASEIV